MHISLSILLFCRIKNAKYLFQSLIRTPSIREKEVKKLGEEILDLLSKPTAIERSLTEKFRSQGGMTKVSVNIFLYCFYLFLFYFFEKDFKYLYV